MMKRAGSFGAGWAVALAASLVAQAPSEIRVRPVVATSSVATTFAAASAVGADIRAVVESGLLVTFTFTVDLRRPVTAWWDRTISREMVSSTIKLDTLSGAYLVSRMHEGHVIYSNRTKNFTEARDWATTFEQIPLAADSGLDPNADYYVEVRMSTSPRRTFSWWPFGSDERTGRADFTFIR